MLLAFDESEVDAHHEPVGNGTQALVMPLNAASHREDLMVQADKPPTTLLGRDGKRRRGWKGFYGSVHDIVRPGPRPHLPESVADA